VAGRSCAPGLPRRPGRPGRPGGLTGAAAVSPTDAWAVGSYGTFKTLILHWDGTAWAKVPSP